MVRDLQRPGRAVAAVARPSGGDANGGVARNGSRARVRRRSSADEGWPGRRLCGQPACLTLFPYIDAAPGRFENPIDDGDRAAIIDMLARLHTATPEGIQVPGRPLELAARQAIDQALASLAVRWNAGPHAQPGRAPLARYERPLHQAFARLDGLLDRVR